MDLLPKRTEGEGYYLVYYGGRDCAAGPYGSVKEMAHDLEMNDYPGEGYVMWMDRFGGMSTISWLNPDDLLPNPLFT